MSGTTLKPWNKLVRLRDDVRSGELSLQEFAADLFDVVNRTGKRPVYEQPARFFPLTFATTSLRDIVAGTAEAARQECQGDPAVGDDLWWREDAHSCRPHPHLPRSGHVA